MPKKSLSWTTWASTQWLAWPSTPVRWTLSLCALLACAAAAQQPKPAEDLRKDLPPSAIFEQTMQPFDAVRADIANWSDTEQGALAVAIRNAGAECKRLEQNPQDGEELFALARLCATGLDWQGAYSAATRYIRDDKAAHMVQGYQIAVQADLNLQNLQDVADKLTELAKRVPFKEDVDSTFRYAIFYTDVPQPKVALALQQIRQPYLLAAIEAKEHADGTVLPGFAEARAVHLLELLRFNDASQDDIAKANGQIDDAVAKRTQTLSPQEQYQVALARTRYGYIGKPLPTIAIVSSNYDKPFRQDTTTIRLLVVYPQNCVSCTPIPAGIDALRSRLNTSAEAWAIEDASGLNAAIPGQKPSTAHRITTSTPLLDLLGANGTPFFIVTDKEGKVGFLASGTADWFVLKGQDSTTEVVMNRVANYGYKEP